MAKLNIIFGDDTKEKDDTWKRAKATQIAKAYGNDEVDPALIEDAINDFIDVEEIRDDKEKAKKSAKIKKFLAALGITAAVAGGTYYLTADRRKSKYDDDDDDDEYDDEYEKILRQLEAKKRLEQRDVVYDVDYDEEKHD